jgi:hypothetical protein
MMRSSSMFENTRSLKHVCDRYHLLVTQHLTGQDLINLLSVDPRLYKILLGCLACMSKIYVKFDVVDAPNQEDVKYIVRSKRTYTKFRFMCYDSKECTSFGLQILDFYAETMDTLEVFDMVIDENMENVMKNLPKLRHFKVSSFRGNYQHVFLHPGMRYESLTFENLLHPVDLNAIAEFNTAAKTLSFKNCALKNLESFTYFDGYCRNFIFEYNKRSDWSGVCSILKKFFDIDELIITKKSSAGYRLTVNRVTIQPISSINEMILSRRRAEANAAIEDVEMKPMEKLETIIENRTNLFKRRRSISRTINEDSDDASSISSKSSVFSDNPNQPKETFKASLEIDEISLPFIRKLTKAMTFLSTLKIYNVHSAVIEQLFRSFYWLQKITVVKDEFETEFSRAMFEVDTSIDPTVNFSRETMNLVFQHFDMEELLSISTVGKKWNEILGDSECFIKKTVLKLNPLEFRRNSDKVCQLSQRNYENFDASCQENNGFSIAGLELVHVFSSCLVNLTLTDLHLDRISSLKDRFIFPQLKNLKLSNVDVNSCSVLLQNCETLESILLASMPITKNIIERLESNQKLNSLTLIDNTFEYFVTYKITRVRYDDEEEEFIPIDLKLKHYGMLFDRVNSWKVQESVGFTKFVKVFSLRSVETLEVSGVRGEFLMDFMRQMKSIKKLTIKHVWDCDLKKYNFYRIRSYFELEALTFGIGCNVNWSQAFPSTSQISIKRRKFTDIAEVDKEFKKAFKKSAAKMMDMKLFVPQKLPIGYCDPMLRVSEKIHDLMFQHLSGHDVLNAFEVSKTWNNFCKESDSCAKKFILYLKESSDREDRAILENSSRRFSNVIADYYQPTMVKSFSNLRRLSIAFYVPEKFAVADAFPNLQTLIIQKCPAKFYKPENVKKCFQVFANCTTLTFLEIYEAVTCENYEEIQDMLCGNENLKTLKIHECSEFYHLFREDFSHRIHFQLNHLDYRIPQKFSLVGSEFEQNCAKFIRKQKSVKIIDMNLCSAVMLNAIFRLPNVEVLRLLRITGYDHVMLQKNFTIKEFLFPDTPQLYVLNSHQSFDFTPFFDAVPNVEHFYVFSLTDQMVEYAARNLKKLKLLTCDRFSGFDLYKTYNKLRYNRANDVNRTIKIMRMNFNLIDTDERTFARLFVEEKIR